MDISFLQQYVVLVILGICLVAGYICKKWVKDLDNKYIPTIVTILGVVLNIWIAGTVNPEVILGGAVSGLSSTGFHQLLTQFLDNKQV